MPEVRPPIWSLETCSEILMDYNYYLLYNNFFCLIEFKSLNCVILLFIIENIFSFVSEKYICGFRELDLFYVNFSPGTIFREGKIRNEPLVQ